MANVLRRKSEPGFSRRESQIMEIVYAAGDTSAKEIWQRMPEPPSYATVRKLLMILVGKGHLRFTKQGRRYVYSAVTPRRRAGASALKKLVDTFYNGSVEEAVFGLLSLRDREISGEERDRIASIILEAQPKPDQEKP